MCQLYLNTAKRSIRSTRCSIQSPSHMQHLPRTIHYWNEIQPFLHGEKAISHGQCTWDGFQFLPHRKLWHKFPIIKVSYNPMISCNFGKSPGSTTPCPTHFHVHLCNNLHSVSQHPHDPAPQMLPHGKCAKLLSNFAIFLTHLKAFTPHHSEAYHAQPPNHFQAPSLCSHFRPLHSQW